MPYDTTTQTDVGLLYQEHVERIKNLDPTTWDYLFNTFRTRLRSDITASLRKQATPTNFTDDIEQQTWLVALENVTHFDWQGEEKFYHWLRVISKHLIYELRHDLQRTMSFADFEDVDEEDSLDHFLDLYAHANDNIEDMVDLRQRMAVLEQSLHILKSQEREIFVRWLMGERPRYLAAMYGMKGGSLRHMLHRAKEKVLSNLKYLDDKRDTGRLDD